jgi:superfamily II DNA/RNA helicase
VGTTLYDLIPREEKFGNDILLGRFLEYTEARGLQLYPAQEAAILELFEEKNVILNTPTGSGKSLVAAALHFKAIARGQRSVYTCPIKALVNEKFMVLCREFGPDNVGLSTGDASVNRDAPILCCTAEILANIALREGAEANFQEVVMDEFHYYADRERGVAWQIPLLTLPQARFLLMSATLGDTTFFEEELTRLNGRETISITSTDRPVPLEHAYSELSLAKTLETLVADRKTPVYVVHFTQLEAAQSAQDFTSINVCTREEKNEIGNALDGFKFSSPYGPDIRKWLKHGIGLHHAGLLPKYRVLVEQLAQRGLLKVICGTDTLGVGINVPIRTVLFTRLCKFDGQKTGILTARDFHQIGGRAGRKGFDDRGWVIAQAPEHVIENLKLAEKSRDGKKTVKRRPPEKNFVNWDKNTFSRLIAAPPERLTSRFQISHAMLLNVLSRKDDGCAAMQKLIRDSHETPRQKQAHIKRAWQLFRSLLDRKIIEFIPVSERESGSPRIDEAESSSFNVPLHSSKTETGGTISSLSPDEERVGREPERGSSELSDFQEFNSSSPRPSPPLMAEERGSFAKGESTVSGASANGRKLRVNIELQEDFSMDQALSLYLLETIPLMDPQQPDYALVLLTLVESILEDPAIILRKQLDRVKDEKMAEMKMEGIEYDQRMEELEKLEHPKPNREFVYSTFNAFADRHPWVGQENIRLKSIAREMFESFRSFSDYIRDYELQRAEGVLLRHLNSVFKVLTQTVPDSAKNDAVREMEIYLGSMIRQVDSSLLDEWEKLRDPNYQRAEMKEIRPPGAEEGDKDITRDVKNFTAAIRNRIFTFLRGLVIHDFDQAIASLNFTDDSDGQPWTAERLKQSLDEYYSDHQNLCLDPNARNARHTYVVPSEDKKTWRVQQMLVDPEEHNDWVAEFEVDLAASRTLGGPALKLRRIGNLV